MLTIQPVDRKGLSLTYEHLMLWQQDDLSEAYFNATGAICPPDRSQAVKRLEAYMVAGVSPEYIRFRSAQRVATLIVFRWHDAGAPKWRRNAAGIAVPDFAALPRQHQIKPAYKFSPSGKALFCCWSCDLALAPSQREGGVCPGRRVHGAEYDLALAIHGGSRYEIVTGVPLPTNIDVTTCNCCHRVGPWVHQDKIFHEVVCELCHDDSVAYLHDPKLSFPGAMGLRGDW